MECLNAAQLEEITSLKKSFKAKVMNSIHGFIMFLVTARAQACHSDLKPHGMEVTTLLCSLSGPAFCHLKKKILSVFRTSHLFYFTFKKILHFCFIFGWMSWSKHNYFSEKVCMSTCSEFQNVALYYTNDLTSKSLSDCCLSIFFSIA